MKHEDPTRRKIFKRLTFIEGSPVTRGGNQHAHVLMVRTVVGEKDVPEKTWLQRIADIFRSDHGDEAPSTTSEILAKRAMLDRLHQVESAFYSSLHEILQLSRGREQIKLLKKSVEEFGNELENVFPKEAKAAVNRLQDDEKAKKKKGKTPPQFLAKDAKKKAASSKKKDGDTDEEEEEISKEVKKAVKRCADIGLIALSVEELSDGDIENIVRCIPENFNGRVDDLGGEMKLQEALDLVTDKSAREAIDRAIAEAKPAKPETPTTADVVRGLPSEAQVIFRDQAKEVEGLKLSNTALLERMDKRDAEHETARITRVAKEFVGVGEKTEAELIETLRKAAVGGVEDVVVESLRAAKTIRDEAQEGLLGELGGSGKPASGVSAKAEVKRLFDELKEKNPDVNETVLMSRLWVANPELSRAVENEERAALERN